MSPHNPTGIDAYKPSEISRLAQGAGVAKANLPFLQMLTLGVLAGVFIALGGAAYTMVMTGVDSTAGPARLLGGMVFSLGLILVVVGGAELFTGNALMIMAAVDRRIPISRLLRNWAVVYGGNLLGSLAIVWLMALTGLLDGAMGGVAERVAQGKADLTFEQAFARGILCNTLVCLAVWLSLAARTVPGKILAILWPISGFVLLGLEHSIANMYLIPQGMVAGANVSTGAAVANIWAVTLGNIVGGVGGVALSYRLAYGSPKD